MRPGVGVRIESPGKSFEAERALLAAGADAAAREGLYEYIPRHKVEQLAGERGLLLPSRQWYLGLCRALRVVEDGLAACPPHTLMGSPADIASMFDKPRCHALMDRAGIPVPRGLGTVRSHAELVERMRESGCPRVFVKLAHGSSASGVVAYEVGRGQQQATTTVELTRHDGALRLYNSRRIKVYRELGEIVTLIDALCRHRVHVERWLPKAGLGDRAFDLRVVVIGGRARHVVARASRSPMTNLHLLNKRGDVDTVVVRMGPLAWEEALRTCERAAALFPDSLYAGVDLLVAPDYRRHAVLEINAFGDLLPGALSDGVDTYTAELIAS